MTTKNITVRDALQDTSRTLKDGAIEDHRAEAEYLLAAVLKVKRHGLFLRPDRVLTEAETSLLSAFIKRRAFREPSQYITGETEFRGLPFKVTRAVLIPRPETEMLVDEALKTAPAPTAGGFIAIDLCTGSGCIAVSLAKEAPECRVFATDVSGDALAIAMENASINGVADRMTFVNGDLFAPLEPLGLERKAALILSNPPYISSVDMEKLPPEIRDFEPRTALWGGEDGLEFFRRIVKDAPRYLTGGGSLILEMGYSQATGVKAVIETSGEFDGIAVRKDFSGIERVISARKKSI